LVNVATLERSNNKLTGLPTFPQCSYLLTWGLYFDLANFLETEATIETRNPHIFGISSEAMAPKKVRDAKSSSERKGRNLTKSSKPRSGNKSASPRKKQSAGKNQLEDNASEASSEEFEELTDTEYESNISRLPPSRKRERSTGNFSLSESSTSSRRRRNLNGDHPSSPQQFISLEDIFWGKKKQRRRPKTIPNINKEGTQGESAFALESSTNSSSTNNANQPADHAKSNLELYARDLSTQECHVMEAQLTKERTATTTGLALPHTVILWNVLPSGNATQLTAPSSKDICVHQDSYWTDHKRVIAKPSWTSLRYHNFFDSMDYNEMKYTPRHESNSMSALGSNDIDSLLPIQPSVPEKSTSDILERVRWLDIHCAPSPNSITMNEQNKSLQSQDPFLAASDDGLISSNRHDKTSISQSTIRCSNSRACSVKDTDKKKWLQLKSSGLSPIPRECTVLAHSRHSPHLALGDTAGYITLYNSKTLTSINRLETSASASHHRLIRKTSANEITPDKLHGDLPFDGPPHAAFFRKALSDHKDRKDSGHVSARSLYSIEALCFTPIRKNAESTTKSKESLFIEGIVYATKDIVELLHPNGVPLWRIDLKAYRIRSMVHTSNNAFGLAVLQIDSCQDSGLVCIGFQEYFGLSPLLLIDTAATYSSSVDSYSYNSDKAAFSPAAPKMRHCKPYYHNPGLNSVNSLNPIPLGPRACGIWSIQNSDFLFSVVTTVAYGDYKGILEDGSIAPNSAIVQELLVIDNSSSSDDPAFLHPILAREPIPVRKRGSNALTTETLYQSPDGRLLAVGSTGGGIRLLLVDFSSPWLLQLLGVYGEGIKMHGNTVSWHQVQIQYVPVDDKEEETHYDELEFRNRASYNSCQSKTARTGAEFRTLVIGISHPFREPKDTRDTIYVWDISQHIPSEESSKDDSLVGTIKLPTTSIETEMVHDIPKVNMTLPTFTLNAPSISLCSKPTTHVHKDTHGIQSLAFIAPSCHPFSSTVRIILTTHGTGECFVLQSTLRSTWAGCMYGPEYVCIDNNIDYIEDEDEVDYNIDLYREMMLRFDKSCHPQFEDTQLAENEADVLLISDNCEKPKDYRSGIGIISLWKNEPEFFLQESVVKEGNNIEKLSAEPEISLSSVKLNIARSLLPVMDPKSWKRKRPGIFRLESSVATNNITSRVGGGSTARRRGSNRTIESMLVSSVNETLQEAMTSSEDTWSMRPDLTYQTSKGCLACNGGRLIPHKCKVRLIPLDTETIVREHEEHERKIAEEEKRLKIERKKKAERKRRQERRDKATKDKSELDRLDFSVKTEIKTGDISSAKIRSGEYLEMTEVQTRIPSNQEQGFCASSVFPDDNSAAAADLIALSQGFHAVVSPLKNQSVDVSLETYNYRKMYGASQTGSRQSLDTDRLGTDSSFTSLNRFYHIESTTRNNTNYCVPRALDTKEVECISSCAIQASAFGPSLSVTHDPSTRHQAIRAAADCYLLNELDVSNVCADISDETKPEYILQREDFSDIKRDQNIKFEVPTGSVFKANDIGKSDQTKHGPGKVSEGIGCIPEQKLVNGRDETLKREGTAYDEYLYLAQSNSVYGDSRISYPLSNSHMPLR